MTVLSVEDLRISYRSRGEWREVVHNISFSIQRGEMLAFVGESGSGKTTTAQAIIGLLADNARRDAGRIVLNGAVISDWSDKRLNRLRGVSISLVPQDPGNSLNPVKTIGQQVEEILRLHQSLSAAERRQQVLSLLAKVGLSHPEQRFDQYPHQLSGGMKQRVLIAIAIALQPDLIIADEPTSALDVTVQKRILDLLDILRRESGTAVLFVTHDHGVSPGRDSGTRRHRDDCPASAASLHPPAAPRPAGCAVEANGGASPAAGHAGHSRGGDQQTLLAGQTGAAGARQRQL